MATANEAQNTATGGIPKTQKEFEKWFRESRLPGDKWGQAKVVELSFKTLALNKNNPAALAKAQQMHDADMAKLEAMFNP